MPSRKDPGTGGWMWSCGGIFEIPGFDVKAIDLNPAGPDVEPGDMRKLDFPGESFDCCLAECSISGCGKGSAALREAFRVLKQDGCLLVSDVFFHKENAPCLSMGKAADMELLEGGFSGSWILLGRSPGRNRSMERIFSGKSLERKRRGKLYRFLQRSGKSRVRILSGLSPGKEREMDLFDRMLELSGQGFYCAQILMILALESEEKEDPDLIRAMGGLNGGLGFSGRVCGALTGGCCFLSYFLGKGEAEELEDPEAALLIESWRSGLKRQQKANMEGAAAGKSWTETQETNSAVSGAGGSSISEMYGAAPERGGLP